MKIDSKPFGTIDVDERQRITFPQGLFGFEELREFVLLDAVQPPFYWLQSVEDQEVAFVLIEPRFFRPDYKLEIDREDREEIGIGTDGDPLVFAIVTIPNDDHERMSANLQGPVVINRQSRIARQTIATNSRWRVKHYIIEELQAVREQAC